MTWQRATTLAWEEPLAFASHFAGRDMALLYSGLHEQFTGTTSYLLVDPLEERSGHHWDDLPEFPQAGESLPFWVGYLGYGMRETAERGSRSPIHLPDFCFVRYAQLYCFDHHTKTITAYTQDGSIPSIPDVKSIAKDPIAIKHLTSNLTRAEYEQIITDTLEHIRAGNFYQANITRKFFGEFEKTPDSWQIFSALCAASPAPYSAYIRHGKTAILSSSPECFLTIDAHGVMTTRPIKGSARRAEGEIEDKHIREALNASAKNHAENLMIVDLMRNDLARVSEPMSVKVVEQSKLYSYRTIHHLISTIQAQKSPHISAYDAVKACFPAGSMTGAPKIAAMHWCTTQERLERGVYSGAIGWFGPQNSCDLSVVIRTLIINENNFEFQVGGGIIVDSTPSDEWRETITKSRGILMALGLTENDLGQL